MSQRESCTDSGRGDPIVHFQTSQSTPLLKIFEACRDLITDLNLHFVPDGDDNNTPGILFMAMSDDHVAMVHLKMPAEQIRRADTFVCRRGCCAGIHVTSFCRCLKTISSHEEVSLTLYEGDTDNLYLTAEDPRVRKWREFKIPLLDIDEEQIPVPDAQFDCVFTMNAAELRSLCQQMSAVEPDTITVENHGHSMVWKGRGENTLLVRFDTRTENAAGIVHHVEPNVQRFRNRYSLKYLTMFTRASGLCTDVRIHLKRFFPIILDFEIAGLGSLRFCLAPKVDEDPQDPDNPDPAESEQNENQMSC